MDLALSFDTLIHVDDETDYYDFKLRLLAHKVIKLAWEDDAVPMFGFTFKGEPYDVYFYHPDDREKDPEFCWPTGFQKKPGCLIRKSVGLELTQKQLEAKILEVESFRHFLSLNFNSRLGARSLRAIWY